MKIVSLTLAYNQESYIKYSLSFLSKYMDCMIIMYSDDPFTEYNPLSRSLKFCKDNTLGILKALTKEIPQLKIIEGIWSNENDMRNQGLIAAKSLKYDYLFIIDADEFYHHDDFIKLIEFIKEHPYHDSYWCKFQVPFKDPNYFINRDDEFLPVVIRLSEVTKFINRRIPSGHRFRLPLEIKCYNMGFILSDRRMLEKILTYSHAHQIPKNWYEEKWSNWTPQTINLHTRIPELWPGTKRMHIHMLPEILHNHLLIKTK